MKYVAKLVLLIANSRDLSYSIMGSPVHLICLGHENCIRLKIQTPLVLPALRLEEDFWGRHAQAVNRRA